MNTLRCLALSSVLTVSSVLHAASAHSAAPTSVLKPDAALALLLEGNQRFVSGTATHPHQSGAHRASLAEGQKPFAIVLTCADSRVAPELYFDQGLGDLFVLRNAGNVLDDHIVGSIEYAIEHLHAGLIIVVGHSKCGAVSAAVAGGHAPGHIHTIVDSIKPAVDAVKGQSGDPVDLTVRTHARRVAEILQRLDPIVGAAVKDGHVKVVASRYDLATGRIELLP